MRNEGQRPGNDPPLAHHPSSDTTLVIGLGNPLRGDDGVGSRIIEELEGLELPDGVMVVEGGTAGLGLIGLMEGYQRVIVVDAADMGHPPGRVVRFTPPEVQLKTVEPALSPHEIGLWEVLALAETLEVIPAEVVIIGIQPSRLGEGAELSPEVERAIPQAIRTVLNELDAVGRFTTLNRQRHVTNKQEERKHG